MLNLEDSVLEKILGLWAQALEGDGDAESDVVSLWLRQENKGGPRPPFFRPSIYAGPDHMFVLRKTVDA